jgi:hypothetical protein
MKISAKPNIRKEKKEKKAVNDFIKKAPGVS